MYNSGLGVPQDPVEAYKWLSISGAETLIGVLQEGWVEKGMTPAQISEAQQRASDWKKAHQ